MKLITEQINDVKVIVEERGDGGKSYFIEGPFMVAEQKNKNGRIYETKILARECARYTKEYIKENRAYGELGHPQGPNINLERVSHMIKEMRQDGNHFIGRAKILETPYGNIVSNLLKEGASLGVSSRGMGSLQERNGAMWVCEDFHLATPADIVADPSAPGAFVQGVMEGKEWLYNNGVWTEAAAFNARAEINNAARSRDRKQLEEQILKSFNRFINGV